MERLKLAGFGRNGAVLDVAEYDAPPESFNEVRNARFNSTGAVAFSGHKSVLSPAPITPLWLRVFPPVDFPRWVYADLNKVYVFDDGHIDISRPGGYSGNANERWQGEIFSGVGIFNNTIDVPQMWPAFNSATQLADLDNWPTNIRCKALRPFKNYLIAMYLIEDGNDHPFRVRWSHPADPGTVPISWDISNPAYDTGEMEFSETDDYLVDGKTLGESFIVYKQKTAHIMYLTGNNFIFGQRTIISGRGALTRDCVQDIPGGHFVAGLDDIYVHSGQKGSEQSLVEAKVRKWIYNQIDASNYFNCFTVDYKSENEIWFCFPEAGETYATIAMVWNKVTGGIGFRDLQQTPFIWSGQVDERTEDGDIWGGEEVALTAEGALTIGIPTVEGEADLEVVVERTPMEMEFTEETLDVWVDPGPAAMLMGTEPFTTDTGQFTITHYASDPEGSLSFGSGQGTLTTPSGASSTFAINTDLPVDYPMVFVSVDIVSVSRTGASYFACAPGIYKDAANALALDFGLNNDGSIQFAGFQAIVGGTKTTFSYLSSPPGGTVTKLGFGLSGQAVSCWAEIDGVWALLNLVDATPYMDTITVGNLTGFYAGISLWADAAGKTLVLDNMRIGRLGGQGLRDNIFFFNENQTPYMPSPGVAMFSATVMGCNIGIFTIDLTTWEITQVGVVLVERSGKYYTDLNLSVLAMEDGSAVATTATWRNGFGGSIKVQIHSLADQAILTDPITILDSPTTPTLPGLLTGSYGSYDSQIVWDKANSRYLLAYNIVTDTNFGANPFYPAAAHSTDLSTWTAIGQDTGVSSYEGTKLCRHKGQWWITAGGPVPDGDVPRVYDASDMSYEGGLDITITPVEILPPHMPLVAWQDTVYLLTFDGTEVGGFDFTQGNPLLFTSPRFV